MNPNMSSNLEEYKKACESLINEVNLSIQDAEFIKANGNLRYAIDFSEIFAYVLPSDTYGKFIVFPDAFDNKNEIADAIALQQLVLRYILFELPKTQKLILLPPYAFEFSAFVKSLRSHALDKLVEHAIQAFSDFEKIINEKLDSELEAICQKIDREQTISEIDIKKLADFVQQYGHLQAILEGGESARVPFHRIKELDPTNIFTPITELISPQANLKTTVKDRWVTELSKLRSKERRAATELDAVAINMIHEVNLQLEKNTRLLLITRSETMHALYQNEFKNGFWKDAGEYPLLRHPRAFTINLSVAQKSITTGVKLEDLEALKETIEWFLKAYALWEQENQANQENREKLPFDQELFDQIEKIKQYWKQIQKTALPMGTQSPLTSPINLRENAKLTKTILDYARKNQDINQRIVDRVDELFYDIDRAHEVLGLELYIPSQFQNRKSLNKWELHTSFLLSPYKLQFETTFAQEVIKELSITGLQKRPNDIASIIKKGFEKDTRKNEKENYEIVLIMAYLLGLLGKWKIAESYCERAIKTGHIENIPTYEATYFNAICKREGITTKNWRYESLSLLDQALTQLNAQRADENLLARYSIEKGITNLIFSQSDNRNDTRLAEDSLTIIDRWEKKLKDNLPLQLYIFRIKMDYFALNRHFWRLKDMKDQFQILENAIIKIDNDETNWPPYMIDVLNWGKWVFFSEKFSDINERNELIKQLRNGLNKETSRRRKSEISRHIKDIENEKIYKL